jgi:hypothetical protein
VTDYPDWMMLPQAVLAALIALVLAPAAAAMRSERVPSPVIAGTCTSQRKDDLTVSFQ